MQTEINYDFYTAWSPCCPVVEEMAKQYPNLKFEHKYYEPGCGFAGKDTYENGELVDEEYYDCENRNDYAEFTMKEFGEFNCRCSNCGMYIYEYELDDNDFRCPNCNSKNIIMPDGRKLTANNYFKSRDTEKDENGLLKPIRRVG